MSEAQFMLILQRQREREQQQRKELEDRGESLPVGTSTVSPDEQPGVMDIDHTPHEPTPAMSINENNSLPLGMFPPTARNGEGPLETLDHASLKGEERPKLKKLIRKSKFGMYEDIEEMMFGFGDDWPPAADTIELVEDLAVKYIKDLCQRAAQVAGYTGKLDKQCFMYAVRKDTRKFTRAYALLKANEELKAARTTTIAEEEKITTDALPNKSSSYTNSYSRVETEAVHSSSTVPVAEVGTANSASLAVGEESGQGSRGGRGGGRGRGSRGRGDGSDGSGRGRGRGRGGGESGKLLHETSSDGDGNPGSGGSGRGGTGRGGRGRGSEKAEGGRGRGRGRGRGTAAVDILPSDIPSEQQTDASLPDNMLAV